MCREIAQTMGKAGQPKIYCTFCDGNVYRLESNKIKTTRGLGYRHPQGNTISA